METKSVPVVNITLDQLRKGAAKSKKSKQLAKRAVVQVARQVSNKALTNQERGEKQKILRRVQNQVLRPGAIRTIKDQVLAIAKSIATPGDCEPIRVSTVFSGEKTAVAAPFSKSPEVPSTVDYANRLMPVGEQVTYVRRCPEAAIIRYIPWDGTTTSAYQAVEVDPDTLQADLNLQFSNDGFERPLKFPYLQRSGGGSPHGNLYLTGMSAGRPGMSFWWCRTGDTIDIHVFNLDLDHGTRNYSCMIYAWDSRRSDFQIGSLGFTVPADGDLNQTFTVPTVGGQQWHGYVGIAIKGNDAGAETSSAVQVLHTWRHDVFAHLPLPDLLDNISAAPSIRIIGASNMYTNTASPLNRQGEITGYQSPEGTHWMDYVANYTVLKSRKMSRTLDIVKGMYGFLKITDADDLNYKSKYDATETGNNIIESKYPIDDEHPFLVLYHKTTGGTTESGYSSTDFVVEYQSGDTWRQYAAPECDVESYNLAIQVLRDVEQFYENPTHRSEIFNKIREFAIKALNGVNNYGSKALSAAVKYGPSVLEGAATLASMLA
jgi:hypothetical protein